MPGSIPMQMCQMDFDFSVRYLQNLKLTSMSTKLVFRCYYNTNLWMLFSRGMESTFGYSMVSLKQMEDVGMSRNQISCLKWVKMVKSLILWNHDQWRQSWRWCKFYTGPSSRKFKAKLQSNDLHSFFLFSFLQVSLELNILLPSKCFCLEFPLQSHEYSFLLRLSLQSKDYCVRWGFGAWTFWPQQQ